MGHTGSREKLSVYVSMAWPDVKLMMYDFYDDTNAINHLENLYVQIMKTGWKRLILI
jgi:hypothetical protein